jgi:hypothetical protein
VGRSETLKLTSGRSVLQVLAGLLRQRLVVGDPVAVTPGSPLAGVLGFGVLGT